MQFRCFTMQHSDYTSIQWVLSILFTVYCRSFSLHQHSISSINEITQHNVEFSDYTSNLWVLWTNLHSLLDKVLFKSPIYLQCLTCKQLFSGKTLWCNFLFFTYVILFIAWFFLLNYLIALCVIMIWIISVL